MNICTSLKEINTSRPKPYGLNESIINFKVKGNPKIGLYKRFTIINYTFRIVNNSSTTQRILEDVTIVFTFGKTNFLAH